MRRDEPQNLDPSRVKIFFKDTDVSRERGLVQDVERFIGRHRLLTKRRRVLLAVSGGVDSMVLLDVFCRLQRERQWHLEVVHVNHQLRGDESLADEQFVQEACRARGLKLHVGAFDVHAHADAARLSTQLAARELRYAFFEEVRRTRNAHAVATAHHADDNAETVLLNILRGTGVRGLAGIPPRRASGRIIRPLLGVSRAAIESYAETRGIAFRTDSSNLTTAYARNDLRLRILPALVAAGHSNAIPCLLTVSQVMSEVARRLDRLVASALPSVLERSAEGGATLRLAPFRAFDPLLQEHCLLEVFRRLGIDPAEERIAAVLGLAALQAGRVVELPGGWRVRRERTQLEFMPVEGPPSDWSVELQPGSVHRLNGFTVAVGEPAPRPTVIPNDPGIAYVDADRVGPTLRLRRWQHGDWLIPLGLRHRKKVSDLFVERKIPLREKHRIPILESEGSIVWVCGLRLDDRFKLTGATTRALKITYRPTE